MANYRCKHPFAFDVDGVSRVVAVDEVVSSDDPAFAKRQELFGNGDLFEPLEDYLSRRTGVEQATADPGERRGVTRPATRGAAGRKGKDGGDEA